MHQKAVGKLSTTYAFAMYEFLSLLFRPVPDIGFPETPVADIPP